MNYPVLGGGLIGILTVVFAFQIPRLEIDTSAEGLMVEKDPARRYYEEVKQKFGSDILTIVLVKADDVFTAPVLGVIKRLSDALERLEGVTRVESLTTVHTIKGRGEALTTEPLVGPVVPATPRDLERIREEALGNRVLTGNIVSKDARAAAIAVYTNVGPGDRQFNRRFSDMVEALIQQEARRGLTIYQVGGPFSKEVVGEYIWQNLLTLMPASALVLFVFLFLTFRMLQGALVPIATGIVSVVWALGLMAHFRLPLSVLTVIIPALLISIGFTEDVYMLSEYHRLLEKGKDKLTAIRTMAREAAFPMVVTAATTIIGFGSLVTTDVTMLIEFGYASAMALAANFVVTIVMVPILLRIWPVPRRLRLAVGREPTGRAISRMMDRLGEFNLRHRAPIAVVTALMAAASLVGLYHLRVDANFIGYFPERSVIRERLNDLHASLAGASNFYVVVETGRENGLKDPDLLRKIAGLQEFLASTGEVDKSVSVADYLRTLHREMNGGDPAWEVIPDTPAEVAQYLLLLEGRELGKYVDFTASTANIVVRNNINSSWEFSALLGRIDAYVAKTFPRDVSVRYTGESILIKNAADYMAINELTSFSFTFVLIGLIHALLFRSLRAGFLSLIPDLIPILFNFGLMGLLGIPLNPGTAMIATIAIGIAVDDTVHHVVTYSRQLNAHGDRKRAMVNTMRIQGRPIIYVSLTLAAGFFVLVFSNFVPTVQFGALSALVMLVAMITELILTPILMYSIRLARPLDAGWVKQSGKWRDAIRLWGSR
ncbi:MAG: RND family transporter [Candidatus Rokubacteria bacterium]|nr:RND family transporter [Candidatus Rokubacteria bacterium]